MKKLILFTFAISCLISLGNANATSIQLTLPTYCYGQNIENSADFVEIKLQNRTYVGVKNGLEYMANITDYDGTHLLVAGAIKHMAFAGGGSASWEMSLEVNSFSSPTAVGVMKVHIASWVHEGTDTYQIICEY